MAEMTGLSLYHLDTELTSLLEYRTERLAEPDAPDAEEIGAIDGQIRAYLAALPKKVDSVAHVLSHLKSQIELAESEIDKLGARKASLQGNLDRLKRYVAEVLDKQPEPARGPKKLVGNSATIALKGNGGLAPLVIDWPDLIPDECCHWDGRLEFADVQELRYMSNFTKRMVEQKFTRVPSQALIRKALDVPCLACAGRGMADLGQVCVACGGTGLSGVPGARLDARGHHVEVR